MMEVRAIDGGAAAPWLLQKHYARRMPGISYAFGLYVDMILRGVVTYGSPPTPQIKNGMFHDKEIDIIELNRLCVDCVEKNATSFLVGRSLSLLKGPIAVISYADGGKGHVGYIYQATNFLYTGAYASGDSEYVINGKKTHARTLAAQGIRNLKSWAEENGVDRVKPEKKHRYVYLVGNRTEKRYMREQLIYPVLSEYPKGDVARYDAGGDVPVQMVMF